MFILLWVWRDGKTFRISLPDEQFFEASPTFQREWHVAEQIQVLNPLIRPIPKGYTLVVALNEAHFPYATRTIAQVRDIFNTNENGVYFLADTPTIQHLLAVLKP